MVTSTTELKIKPWRGVKYKKVLTIYKRIALWSELKIVQDFVLWIKN
jgi:hypothetical protein